MWFIRFRFVIELLCWKCTSVQFFFNEFLMGKNKLLWFYIQWIKRSPFLKKTWI